jgi:hypothetical protein
MFSRYKKTGADATPVAAAAAATQAAVKDTPAPERAAAAQRKPSPAREARAAPADK